MGVFVHSCRHLPPSSPSVVTHRHRSSFRVSASRECEWSQLRKVPNCGKSFFVGLFNKLDFCFSFYTQSHRPADPFSWWIKVKACASVPDFFFSNSKQRASCNNSAAAERPIQPRTSESHSHTRGAVHILQVTITSAVDSSLKKLHLKQRESLSFLDAVILNSHATVTTCPSRTLIISLAESTTRVPGIVDQCKMLHCQSQYYGKWQLWANFEQFHGWSPIASWQHGVYDGSDTGSLATHLPYRSHLARSFTPMFVDVPFKQPQRKPFKRGNIYIYFGSLAEPLCKVYVRHASTSYVCICFIYCVYIYLQMTAVHFPPTFFPTSNKKKTFNLLGA